MSAVKLLVLELRDALLSVAGIQAALDGNDLRLDASLGVVDSLLELTPLTSPIGVELLLKGGAMLPQSF